MGIYEHGYNAHLKREDTFQNLILFEGPHKESLRKLNVILYVHQACLLYCLYSFKERYLSDLCIDFDEQDTVGKLSICSL